MRKRTNALRRYQRTRKHERLREQRKTIYLAEKARYEATIKREKIVMEGLLQSDILQPMERSVQISGREKKGQHTKNKFCESATDP